jgi:Legionella pneumophila major outer membrane protein precursor
LNRFTRIALLLCLALATSAVSRAARAATIDEQNSARLDALEKENAALRARVNRLEAPKAAKIQHRPAVEADPAFTSAPRPQNADTLATYPVKAVGAPISNAPRFEVSGSLLYLQPGAGDLEYGTLVTPFPIATPNWNNQSLSPKFSPAFTVGARYMAKAFNDIELNWTHLNATTNASFTGNPAQMVGPPFLIGPEANDYKIGQGTVKFAYDSVKLDGGHTFCADCSFQLRAFGGVEFARIGQNLGGAFLDPDGSASMSYTTPSMFTGAGPRLGLKGQYALGDFQFIGEAAGAGLIGTSQARINVSTISPAIVGPNNQSLTSPNATQVVPSIEARLATAYAFPANTYGQFKIEAGYQAAVYFDAVSHYALTSVPTAPMIPPVGIFLATAQHLQSNFTDQGPYVTGSWLF